MCSVERDAQGYLSRDTWCGEWKGSLHTVFGAPHEDMIDGAQADFDAGTDLRVHAPSAAIQLFLPSARRSTVAKSQGDNQFMKNMKKS